MYTCSNRGAQWFSWLSVRLGIECLLCNALASPGGFNAFRQLLIKAVAQTSVSRKELIDAYPESSKADFCTKNI